MIALQYKNNPEELAREISRIQNQILETTETLKEYQKRLKQLARLKAKQEENQLKGGET
jgi:chromosome segregation ATPase